MDSKALRTIKLRHLSAFVETVRCGSLKRASERLHVTQSAISKSIKDLELILGVVLLKRDRGGVEMTREGAVFRQFAEQGLASVSHGLTSLDALTTGAETPVRIGALPSVAADFLPTAIAQFSALSPRSMISVEDGRIATLVERLRAGELDLVLGRMARPETMMGLSFTQLYSEQVVFAAAAGHEKAEETDPKKLGDALILSPPAGAAIRPIVDRYRLSEGIGEWPNTLETVSSAFGRAMTLGPAQAIWIISQGVVARDITAGRMVRVPIDTASMDGPVGIMARSEEDPAPAIKLFRQALLNVAAQKETQL